MGKGKWIAVAAAGTFVAMTFGPQGPAGGFWGATPAAELGITGSLAGAFMGYALIEAVAFGLGIAWLAFGRQLLGRDRMGTGVYLAVAWVLASWWPHSAFHQVIGEGNPGGLIRVEYAFHFTMIVAAAIIADFVWRTVRNEKQVPAAIG